MLGVGPIAFNINKHAKRRPCPACNKAWNTDGRRVCRSSWVMSPGGEPGQAFHDMMCRRGLPEPRVVTHTEGV